MREYGIGEQPESSFEASSHQVIYPSLYRLGPSSLRSTRSLRVFYINLYLFSCHTLSVNYILEEVADLTTPYSTLALEPSLPVHYYLFLGYSVVPLYHTTDNKLAVIFDDVKIYPGATEIITA